MKKTRLLGLTLALLGTVTMLAACGSKKESAESSPEHGTEAAATENTAEIEFGKKSEEEYPISDEVRKKLDALTTNYSKVNWEAEYMPTDGIVVSEGTYIDTQNMVSVEYHHLVVAFTNTTDQNIKLSLDGNVEGVDGTYIQDIFTDDIEIWAGNTVAITLELLEKVPSGNIKWNKVEIQPLDLEYTPYEISAKLDKGDSGNYSIKSEVVSDPEHMYSYSTKTGCGLILDKDGKILSGNSLYESSWDSWSNLSIPAETFNGENADQVIFVNLYLPK